MQLVVGGALIQWGQNKFVWTYSFSVSWNFGANKLTSDDVCISNKRALVKLQVHPLSWDNAKWAASMQLAYMHNVCSNMTVNV